jgi:hypothetical protein
MTTFLLVPGAGGAAVSWSRVAARLEAAGHTAIPVDLPGDDPHAGLAAYADRAVAAADGRAGVVLVAQSMGGFTASERLDVAGLVFLNAMIPLPGETANGWFAATGSADAARAAARAGGYGEAFDLETYFLHDVPPEVAAELGDHARDETGTFDEPCAFSGWPDVPTVVLAGTGDRLFPFAFQARVAAARLGLEATAVPGGHLCALSEPAAVAAALMRAAA